MVLITATKNGWLVGQKQRTGVTPLSSGTAWLFNRSFPSVSPQSVNTASPEVRPFFLQFYNQDLRKKQPVFSARVFFFVTVLIQQSWVRSIECL